MTQLPDKELLSAFVDDELSAAQRDEIERWLASSAEARQEVDDYRSLSGLLRGLPREQVPAEFKSQVLQAAERGMLLNEPAAVVVQSGVQPLATAATQTGRPPRSARKTAWSAAAVVAAAAGIMAMVQFIPSSGRNGADLAMHSVESESADDAAPGDSFAARDTDAEIEGLASARPSMARSLEETVADSPTAAAPLPSEAPSTSVLADDADNEVEVALRDRDGGLQHLVFDRNLSEARVGEVLDGFDTSGDDVAVCRVTVVDIKAGLDSLQLLLMRHDVRSTTDSYGDERREADAPAAPKAGQNFAIYVEARHDQLSRALAELKHEAPFRDQQMHVAQTVNVAMLDETVADLAEFRKGESVEDSASGSAALGEPLAEQEAQESAQPAAPQAGEAAEVAASPADGEQKASNSAAEVQSRAKSLGDAKLAATGMSRQFQTEVPADILSGSKESTAGQRQLLMAKKDEVGRVEKQIARGRTADAPIHVLFVLVPAESPGAPPLKTRAGSPKQQPGSGERSDKASPQGASFLERRKQAKIPV